MLLVAEHDTNYEAVPPIERVHCHTAVGLCLYKLKDEDRRDECRQRLQAARQWAGESAAGGEGAQQFDALLADPFFGGGESAIA